jgi:hypothetical protein
MPIRLLSFISDFEQALAADDPSPNDGSWSCERHANYHLGLARLVLKVRTGTDAPQSRGAVLIQSFRLADGSQCIKATLSWTGSDVDDVHSVYDLPSLNWKSEARRLAALWQAGPPPAARVESLPESASESSLAATG